MTIKDNVRLTEALKLSPPLGALSAGAMGANLQTWILWATLIYTILLILHKAFQIWKDVYRFERATRRS